MELRKDPITRSWVITGDDPADAAPRADAPCRFCESSVSLQEIAKSPDSPGSPWSARSVVHPTPLYHIEGEPGRRGDGIYDRMHSVGAHEVLVENRSHDRHLWNAGDEEIAHFLRLAAERILDLKRDPRIKYVSFFKDYGKNAGQEFSHPTSQITATMFVPRRVLYELRAGREYFVSKERCVSLKLAGIILRCAPTLRGFLMRLGYCPAITMPHSNGPASTSPASGPTLLRFCAALCSASAPSAKTFILRCTLHRAACTHRRISAIGRPSTTTTTGTLRYSPSWLRRRARTPSKRSTTRLLV